jgi:SAM-dependent methyltransferase
MDDVEQLYEFWRQESPDGNYFTPFANSNRSETILRMMAGLLDPSHSILEIGCNVGRNLDHLWGRGFRNLAGLEISEAAVRRLRDSYPNLSEIPVMLGPAELLLPGLPAGSFDLVFTMAVLEHVHPSQSAVFREIARVSRRYVLAIEPRVGHATHRQYPWDIVGCFEEARLQVIHHASWSSLWPTPLAENPEWGSGFEAYDAWVFETVPGELGLS